MSGRVAATDLVKIELGVDLGRGDAGMAEQFLDGAKVGPTLDQVDGVRVTEHVGAYWAESDPASVLFKDPVRPRPGEGSAPVGQERLGHRAPSQDRTSLGQISLDPFHRLARERDPAGLAPFARHPERR